MKRMSANFPQGGAMDQHFGNMRSLIQVGVVLLVRFSTQPFTLRGMEPHVPPHHRASSVLCVTARAVVQPGPQPKPALIDFCLQQLLKDT